MKAKVQKTAWVDAALWRVAAMLEPFHKFCSHAVHPSGSGLFGFCLRFRSVTGHCGHAPSLKSCQKPKILAPHGYTISGKAPEWAGGSAPIAFIRLNSALFAFL